MKRNLKMLLAAAIAAAGLNAMANAVVTLRTVTSHDPWDGMFDVVYTLSGVDASTDYKIAFDVTANGTKASVTNAAAKLVDGQYTKTLDTVELFGAITSAASAKVRVTVLSVWSGTHIEDATGDAVGAIGDVMLIDISGGSSADSYPVTYVSGVDIGTLNCDVYKTTKIALRKVAAGTAYPVAPGSNDTISAGNVITPAKDYYIGVFPITAAQYALVMGEESSSTAPKADVSWNSLRGGVATATAITASSGEGFFQKLCAKCGVGGFDLPTEVQWEIAARAGSTAVYGSYLKEGETVVGSSENASDFAVYGLAAAESVGTKCPNAWGLFNTAANVREWCRDDYVANGTWTDAETPQSNSSGLKVIRGGSYSETVDSARLTNRNNKSPGFFYTDSMTGFRLVRVCD